MICIDNTTYHVCFAWKEEVMYAVLPNTFVSRVPDRPSGG